MSPALWLKHYAQGDLATEVRKRCVNTVLGFKSSSIKAHMTLRCVIPLILL